MHDFVFTRFQNTRNISRFSTSYAKLITSSRSWLSWAWNQSFFFIKNVQLYTFLVRLNYLKIHSGAANWAKKYLRQANQNRQLFIKWLSSIGRILINSLKNRVTNERNTWSDNTWGRNRRKSKNFVGHNPRSRCFFQQWKPRRWAFRTTWTLRTFFAFRSAKTITYTVSAHFFHRKDFPIRY